MSNTFLKSICLFCKYEVFLRDFFQNDIKKFSVLVYEQFNWCVCHYFHIYRNGLVVSMFSTIEVGRGFASRPGHTDYHIKNGTN